MNQRVQSVLEEAKKLTPAEQEELAYLLLALPEIDSEVDKAWAAEAEDRLAAWRNGELPSVSLGEVIAKHKQP